jgi:transposase-like protein
MPKTPPRYPIDVQRHAAEEVLYHHRPVAQVAKQLCCSPQSVKNWIEKYPPPSHTTFLPLQVGDADLPPSKIELVTKNGLTLRFPVETHPDTLFAIANRFEVSSC